MRLIRRSSSIRPHRSGAATMAQSVHQPSANDRYDFPAFRWVSIILCTRSLGFRPLSLRPLSLSRCRSAGVTKCRSSRSASEVEDSILRSLILLKSRNDVKRRFIPVVTVPGHYACRNARRNYPCESRGRIAATTESRSYPLNMPLRWTLCRESVSPPSNESALWPPVRPLSLFGRKQVCKRNHAGAYSGMVSAAYLLCLKWERNRPWRIAR